MKSKILTLLLSILLSLSLCFGPVYGETEKTQEEALKLYAQSAVLMDGNSGRILYGKEENLKRPMASTTKIMTCILALENGTLEDEVKVSSLAAGQPKVHLGASTDETFRLEDLLYSLMLESHNDAAVMIAEHIGGDVPGFAKMMNQKARDLGCTNTCFITPNGLDAVQDNEAGVEQMHSTTAADLARIMSYCVWESPKREGFLKITQTQNYYFTDIQGKRSFQCTNHNAFLTMMDGVLSGKTGFTGGAGYSYIAALEDNGRKFVVALLGCGWPPHKSYKWSDTRALFHYGLRNYQDREVFQEQNLKPIPVEHGINPESGVGQTAYAKVSLNLTDEEKSLKLLMKEGEKVRILREIPTSLQAPVKAGTVVGSIMYYLEDRPVKGYPIYAAEEVKQITWGWCLGQILDYFLTF